MSWILHILIIFQQLFSISCKESIHVKSNSSLLYMEVTPQKSIVAKATYDIVLPNDRCCPVLEFFGYTYLHTFNKTIQCCNTTKVLVDFLSHMSTSVAVLESNKSDHKTPTTCTAFNATHIQCKGTLRSYSAFPDNFLLLGFSVI